ncbi:MAG: IS30 family transposase [Candidatus Hydrogenedentes bacterium]|jgi:IS30 family transposase|nr:IS30 family transposase [Candidatus Hydrogenedentota bacterium]
MSHHHFTRDDRIKLETLKSQGLSNRKIAQILEFHKSNIGRELRRNSVRGRYCSTAVGWLAINRRQEIERKKKLDHPPHLSCVMGKSYEYWSPEQMSGRLRLEYAGDPSMQVSHETIYLAACNDKRFTNLFVTHWRLKRKKHKKRGLLKGKREVIRDRVSIGEHPAIVASRARLGGLEGDTKDDAIFRNLL